MTATSLMLRPTSSVTAEVEALLRDETQMSEVCRAIAITARVPDRAAAVQDVVADVVCGLLSGEIAFDASAPVAATVIGEGRRRLRRAARDARSFVALSAVTDRDLHALSDSAHSDDQSLTEVGASADRLFDVLPALRASARADADVSAVLELFVRGTVKKSVVMRVAGLSARRYRNARRRLQSLALAVGSLHDDSANVATLGVAPVSGARRRTRAAPRRIPRIARAGTNR